jgi:hypothetical protein
VTAENWLEAAWEHREEVIYRDLFGSPEGNGIYVLKPIFFSRFGDQSLDPRWLHHGVFVFPPTSARSSWLYVTSGLSNAWEDDQPNPEAVSGLGSEFLFQTPERFQWAIGQVLEILAFQLLLAAGRFPGKDLLTCFDRIPLHDSINPSGSSRLTHLLVCATTDEFPEQRLASGRFAFLRLVGISAQEAAFARERGAELLLPLLRRSGAYPVTDPGRGEVL